MYWQSESIEGIHSWKPSENENIMTDIIAEATCFITACYGSPASAEVWTAKMCNSKLSSAPDLKVLPPTTEAFKQHVYRAHFQTAIWKSALHADLPTVNPIYYGWYIDEVSGILIPVTLPPAVSPVSTSVLKMIISASAQPHTTSKCRAVCCYHIAMFHILCM